MHSAIRVPVRPARVPRPPSAFFSGGLNLGLHYRRHSVTRLKYFVPTLLPSFIYVPFPRTLRSLSPARLSLSSRPRHGLGVHRRLVIFTLHLDFSYQNHLRRSRYLRAAQDNRPPVKFAVPEIPGKFRRASDSLRRVIEEIFQLLIIPGFANGKISFVHRPEPLGATSLARIYRRRIMYNASSNEFNRKHYRRCLPAHARRN